MGAELPDWQKNTPEELLPAIEHIRDSFDTYASNCWDVTNKLCYAALHPEATDSTSLAPCAEAFALYLRIVGTMSKKQFDDLLRAGTPPSVFKAYFEVHRKVLQIEVRNQFNRVLQIGFANAGLLRMHPVEWAKAHLDNLINGHVRRFEGWIREVCDKQDPTAYRDGAENFEEFVFWKTWRAPRLIYMTPSGNAAYDPASAWTREDEPKTQELLKGLSSRFVQDLAIGLDKIAGDAHVRLAQTKEHTQVQQPRIERRHQPIRRISNAPTPPTEVGDRGSWDTIEILFLSDERIQIRNGPNTETCNYAEFGFVDGRNGKPNQAWETLRELAEQSGVIREASQGPQAWPKLEKRIQEIRKALREYFGISADPLPFVEGVGYQACFKIGCGPSFDT